MIYESHRAIINRWPSLAAFGADIGVEENTAKQMRFRNSIGIDHWKQTVAAAENRGFADVTLQVLLESRPVKPTKKKPPRIESVLIGPLFATTGG